MTIEQLRKVLEWEQAKGYQDTAVIGGLDNFLAKHKLLNPPLPSYGGLDKQRREQWIKAVLGRLHPVEKSAKPQRRIKPLPPNSPIIALEGANPYLVVKFKKLGVDTVRDLLYFFPRRHIDYGSRTSIAKLKPGIEQTVLVRVGEAQAKKTNHGMWVTEAVVSDDSGRMQVTWFNQPYLAQKLNPNSRLAMMGKTKIWRGNKVFQPTSFELLDSSFPHSGKLVPVYPLTEGMYPRQVRLVVKQALDSCLPYLEDFLPEPVRKRAGLMGLAEAIWQVHYPDNNTSKDTAKQRLAFDELLLLQIGMLSRKRQHQEGANGIRFGLAPEYLEQFLDSLPFELTLAQRRALDEIRADMARDKPMSRLLQGDVGSGKTVVAAAAMLLAVANRSQAALMAPTEVLAEQHFQNICKLLGSEDGDGFIRSCSLPPHRTITIALITGSLGEKAKQEIWQCTVDGEIDILIGTHALIQKKGGFQQLGLAVVDEQHRFGVMQRLELRQKGKSPHVLVMSATPIPRTLALTLYGDLDVSLIDELPPGRQVIKTQWFSQGQRQRGYDFVREQVALGRQAFLICPLIEGSENVESRAATTEYKRLSKEVFPDLRLGLLHGRMSAFEKGEVMHRFRNRGIDILVSTTVLEVGVDVPNATVMLVEGADRFGLSQLHQLRGRVWRSNYQSYCILLADQPSEEARERLSIMESTYDGFRLAEEDLRLRGPGEFLGTRQSGLPELKMAQLTDMELVRLAQREAGQIVESDPQLEKLEHQALASELTRLWRQDNF